MAGKKNPTVEEIILMRRQNLLDQKSVMAFLKRAVLFGLIIYLLFFKVFGISTMGSTNMHPRIGAGDLIVYFRLEDKIVSGDVVVYEKDGKQAVARVIGKPGDKVEITDEAQLFINDNLVIENDIYFRTYRYEEGVKFPITLQDNEYFVLCDYREGAKDSRFHGPVTGEEIKGKVMTLVRRKNI